MTTDTGELQDQQDLDMQLQRYSRMMQILSFAMTAVSIVMAILLLIIKAPIQLTVYITLTILVFLLLFFVFRQGKLRAGFHGLVYLTSLNSLVGNTLIGWRSGIYLILFLMIPVIFYNPIMKKKEKIITSCLYISVIIITIVLGFIFIPTVRFNAFQLQVMNSVNIFITISIMALLSFLDFQNTNKISSRLIELNKKLTHLASQDSLTNLLNRRTMNQFIQMEHVRSKRSGKPFGLIMADVDDFKQVNDQYGHAAGDLVLTELSGLLSATLREQDLISRWGGEEFLILLPETDFDGVQVAAEKIRDLISRSSVNYQGKSISITLSIGGAVCDGHEDWDHTIRMADRALYFGKNHGKNLAIFAKGDHFCVLGYSETSIKR